MPDRRVRSEGVDYSWKDGKGAMWTVNVRLRWAELFTLASLPVVAALLVPAFLAQWAIAVVPALGYVLAIGVSYGLYWRYAVDRAEALEPAAARVTFRVVDARGMCPLGRRAGDLVAVDASGAVAPTLCRPAEEVLRLAAAEGDRKEVKEWCCPVYDHLLVFRPELKAA